MQAGHGAAARNATTAPADAIGAAAFTTATAASTASSAAARCFYLF